MYIIDMMYDTKLVTMGDHNSRCIAFGHFQKFTKTYKKFCIDSIDIKS